MKRPYFVLLLLLFPLFAQSQTVYKEFEVDSVARPHGGIPLLEKFIGVNRRMPHAAEVSHTKGAVILSAIVETNGSLSEVKPLRSLRPDCDREAIRVLSLFKAWKPALKDGKPVRQQITYTIRFVPTGLEYQTDRTIRYFDEKGALTTDESKAAYQLVTPVDTLGFPNGDPVIYRMSGKSWKEFDRYQFKKELYTHYNHDDPTLPDSVDAYRINIQNKGGQTQEIKYSFFADGTLLAIEPHDEGRPSRSSLYYYRNGVVKQMVEAVDEKNTEEWQWFPNGQIKAVALRNRTAGTALPFQLLSQWDSLGNQTVSKGTGQAIYTSRSQGRLFQETGALKNSLKDGEWTGRLDNGQLVYQETYDNGKFLAGKLYDEKDGVIPYNEPDTPPEFKGGMPALGQFLSQNIRYPAGLKVQGRVVVNFVIGTEGNVEDVRVLSGIAANADKEAMRVVKATQGKWKPGIQRGRKVRVRYTLPINFAP